MKKWLLLLLCVAPIALADEWKFTLSPYLWAPTINGTTRFNLPPGSGDGRFDIQIGPNDYLSNLQFTAMVAGEARNGRTSFATDIVYLDFAGEKSRVRAIDIGGDHVPIDPSVNLNTKTSFSGLEWTAVAGRSVVMNQDSTLDLIVGFRYFGASGKASWELTSDNTTLPRTGKTSKDTDVWDGLIGIRGRKTFATRWNVPYYFDIGAGGSSLTWQAMTGVTYAYGWGDVGVVYRHLAYDQKAGALMQNMSFSGPALRFDFHF
jgi:hypothetical protein